MNVRVGPQRKLSAEELMLLNCGVGEDSWESLGQQEVKPVNHKENQSWIFIGRTGAETEVSIFWPLNAKSQLIRKDPDAGKNWSYNTLSPWSEELTHWKRPWCWERLKAGGEQGNTEDDMVGWQHWLNGHEYEETLGDGEGQGRLWCCILWGCKSRHNLATEQQNCDCPFPCIS